MGRFARIRAAEQMERDGIRTLNRHEGYGKERCGHKGEPYMGFVTGCKNPARYHVTGVGIRCYTHASAYRDRGLEPAAEQVPA